MTRRKRETERKRYSGEREKERGKGRKGGIKEGDRGRE